MGNVVYKFGPDMYVEWSSVSDGPISHPMSRSEMAEHLFDSYADRDPDYNDLDLKKVEERLERVDRNNTSERYRYDAQQTPEQLALMWILNGPRDPDCSVCQDDSHEGSCPTPGHMRTLGDLFAMLSAARESYDKHVAEWREKSRMNRERLVGILNKARGMALSDEKAHELTGWLYGNGIWTTRDLDHLEYREWTISTLLNGRWEPRHHGEVMRLFRQWNGRLEGKGFNEEAAVPAEKEGNDGA